MDIYAHILHFLPNRRPKTLPKHFSNFTSTPQQQLHMHASSVFGQPKSSVSKIRKSPSSSRIESTNFENNIVANRTNCALKENIFFFPNSKIVRTTCWTPRPDSLSSCIYGMKNWSKASIQRTHMYIEDRVLCGNARNILWFRVTGEPRLRACTIYDIRMSYDTAAFFPIRYDKRNQLVRGACIQFIPKISARWWRDRFVRSHCSAACTPPCV